MQWKYSNKELPPLDKSYRCLAEIKVGEEDNCWKGYADVFFSAPYGWRKCESKEMVCVLKWVLMEDFENQSEIKTKK